MKIKAKLLIEIETEIADKESTNETLRFLVSEDLSDLGYNVIGSVIVPDIKGRMMTTKDFDKLGNECINHLTALNPKGGIKVFIRMAVEFGYQKAVKNLTIPRVSKRSELLIGLLEMLEKEGGNEFIDKAEIVAKYEANL